MAKNIIFCADGTWNRPDQDAEEDLDTGADPTNVYKFFFSLAGKIAEENSSKEIEKTLLDNNGDVRQVAKYIHGVGDSRSELAKLVGGVFGVGVVSRIVRGYTYISRQFEPGDEILILGFSRGAYTARALASFILKQGLLPKDVASSSDKKSAYAAGFKSWAAYRRSCGFYFDDVGTFVAQIGELFRRSPVHIDVEKIKAVGVWDTVGAVGLPLVKDGRRIDTFKFADTKLHAGIEYGFHAVSLDEERTAYVPTLWDPVDHRIEQLLFAGAHADVGGGYSINRSQYGAGLSDIALGWMQNCFEKIGVIFKPAGERFMPFIEDSAGVAHEEWVNLPWLKLPVARRVFPLNLVKLHASVRERIGKKVIHGDSEIVYSPKGFPAGFFDIESLSTEETVAE